ncbi:MAG: ABC transporter permease [Clostridia bacterium]|nr:ABC transporter permease [Clostridia bacterium]
MKKNTFLANFYMFMVFFFLFAPIVVMILFSFNAGKSTSVFEGFSLYWYKEMISNEAILEAVRNTLLLAVTSSVISTVLGTLAAYGINKMRSGVRTTLMTVTQIPMINPEIITGFSFTLLFVFVGALLHVSETFSFWTMLIAHVTFSLPYVMLQIMPKLKQMDKSLPEAAMDLGCNPVQSFFKVELPEIMPGIVTGLIMAFTLSLDDFVISYFTKGSGFTTLPILIYGEVRKSVKPDIYALATVIFVTVLIFLILFNVVSTDQDAKAKRQQQREKARARRNRAKEDKV